MPLCPRNPQWPPTPAHPVLAGSWHPETCPATTPSCRDRKAVPGLQLCSNCIHLQSREGCLGAAALQQLYLAAETGRVSQGCSSAATAPGCRGGKGVSGPQLCSNCTKLQRQEGCLRATALQLCSNCTQLHRREGCLRDAALQLGPGFSGPGDLTYSMGTLNLTLEGCCPVSSAASSSS